MESKTEIVEDKKYWRGLDELSGTPEFQDYLHREFPQGASEWTSEINRRKFLSLMGASLALGGLSGCYKVAEKIIPYVVTPENLTPGTPLYFATAHVMGGYARGVLVESHTGRPTKIEGNPEHPISKGAADIFDQASVLDLYAPGRSKEVMKKERTSSWNEFEAFLIPHLEKFKQNGGEGLRFLTGATSSLTFLNQLAIMKKVFPKMKWTSFDAISADAKDKSAGEIFGRRIEIHYGFDKADTVLGLDSDFFFEEPSSLKYARDFIKKKRLRRDKTETNRFYALECTPQMTGVSSDHRVSLNSQELRNFCQSLLGELGITAPFSTGNSDLQRWVKLIATDLKNSKGRSVVIPGCSQPQIIHSFAHLLNSYLDNIDKTVFYTEPVLASSSQSLGELIVEMNTAKVEALFILGVNPVYSTPADLMFEKSLSQVPLKIHMGTENDETSKLCDWHLPQSHYLESWGDGRGADGTISIIQPLIVPLYDTKTIHELIHYIGFQEIKSSHDIVKEYWTSKTNWNDALKNGFIGNTDFKPLRLHPKIKINTFNLASSSGNSGNCELVLKLDPTIWDGRFSGNGWLQELPKPISKLVWGNAAFISPKKATDMNLKNGDLIEIKNETMTVQAPIWVLPGQPQNSITLHFGYGRKEGGFSAYKVLNSSKGYFTPCSMSKIDGHAELVTTQTHHSMEGRDLVRDISKEEFSKNIDYKPDLVSRPPSLYGENIQSPENAWGMSIDLGSCIGCNACIVACQAENNIPVVGIDQVSKGREMHWIRVDRYYTGSLDNPTTLFQPVTCMHCEKAPCEVVCPVAATVHSDEGLNEMVYNRCVGTRYCSNNCPYKVRRFNFLEYNKMPSEISKFQKNPDVTVRSRGVMEKCTYCVQRITKARIDAQKEDRPIRDGEIKTACQATCPTDAIVFGNIKDPLSKVVNLKSQPHQYAVLSELGVRPRTTYLARVSNKNEDTK